MAGSWVPRDALTHMPLRLSTVDCLGQPGGLESVIPHPFPRVHPTASRPLSCFRLVVACAAARSGYPLPELQVQAAVPRLPGNETARLAFIFVFFSRFGLLARVPATQARTRAFRARPSKGRKEGRRVRKSHHVRARHAPARVFSSRGFLPWSVRSVDAFDVT